MSYISAIRKADKVIVWERTESGRETKFFNPIYEFYTEDDEGNDVSLYGQQLRKHNFSSYHEFNAAKQDLISNSEPLYESDIPSELKILSENYYNSPAPNLHVTFFDIEVDYNDRIGFATIGKNDEDGPGSYAPINSISFYHQWLDKFVVYAVPPPNWNGELDPSLHDLAEINICSNEAELLLNLLVEIEDSDVICGWWSDFYDVPYIYERIEKTLGKRFLHKLSFEHANLPRWRRVRQMHNEPYVIDLSGRINTDYQDLFKKYEEKQRRSYKLASIADELLPDLPKLTYKGTLHKLYYNDFSYFIQYNIRDTEILKGLEDKLGYVALSNELYHISTGLFRDVTGTLKLAEHAIVNYCHHELNVKVPDTKSPEVDEYGKPLFHIKGAYVLDPKVGMHNWIGGIDITSLYPSGIRSVNISPETLRGQFEETKRASQEIAKDSLVPLTLRLEDSSMIMHNASEWREILKQRMWTVSGYGTVFSQKKKGIIPSILEDWFATRKLYQKKRAEADAAGDKDKKAYYNRLQYIYKIKLNSTYGAMNNPFFKFYDLRLGESTTGTGRVILRHQCAKANEILTGEYSYTGDAIIYGDSVSGDTKIETLTGPIQIKKLFTKIKYVKGNKEYSDCAKYALTYTKETKTNEFKPIRYIVRHKVNKKMYRVWIGNTRYLDVTEDHSLMGYANTKHKTTGIIEVKPSEVGTNNINSLLLCGFLPQSKNHSKFQLSKEMWQLIGFVIGDGHVENRKESGVGVSIGRDDKDEIIRKLINPLIQQGWFTSFVPMKNGHDIRLCGIKGYNFLRTHLYPNGIKQFPDWILEENPKDIAQVLKGYFSVDGFANKNKTIGLCSTNMDFIETANRLLKICGIPSNYWSETTENSFNGVYPGTFTKRLTVYDGVKFGQTIGFIQERKTVNVPIKHSKRTNHRIEQNGYSLIVPTKIEEISHSNYMYVYDIEVDDTHTFYANDLLVHNTDSTYFQTYVDNKELAVKVGDRISQLVNNSFPPFMQNTFLCNEGYDNIINTKREIISDRGIFVDKKRYILHIVDKEGSNADELKIKGVDTIKTTMPAEIAKKINSFIERLLKGESWESISEDIVKYKDELETTNDVMSIGLTKGIKGIEKYTQDLSMDSEIRLPGHVAAGIHYNMWLKKMNDKESLPIISYMKIKVFYLKPPIWMEVRKFKSIALPTDIEQIPQWFLDNFEIDRKAHIERLVDNPLENIIKAIDKVSPSRQSLLVDSLIEL